MSNNGGSLASDIITYIGVPLAVLGVLPILYNTFATLASLSRIKRMLRRSRLTALTRSDVVNRIIEIDLPRYAVMPLDRFRDRSDYWSLSRHPSSIPGGSWSTFNWKTNTIGMKTQRVEYAEDVRQPQVEIAFDELISYLMDLGAVADAQGWKLLRSTGLWTPVGCCLMRSPDGKEMALTIAPQDNADGNLSLAVRWEGHWTSRNCESSPPYWVRLPAPQEKDWKVLKPEESPSEEAKPETGDETTAAAEPNGQAEREEPAKPVGDISCQILASGVAAAFPDGALDSNSSVLSVAELRIDHVRSQLGNTNGTWFAAAATAYGTTSNTTLWNYNIPDEIVLFSRKDSVPCGVLVMMGIVDESLTPDWATKHNDMGLAHDQFVTRTREQHNAVTAELRMNPAERQAAVTRRMQREMEQRMQDMRDRSRLERERAEQRMMEALQSPKWNNKVIADHCLRWLQHRGEWNEKLTVREVVGFMLHRMVTSEEFTTATCRMLDTWKSWSDNGGMRRADFQMIRDDPVMFAQTTLFMSLVTGTSTGAEGTLAMDLQECMRLWRKVRLG